jgi:hypothetical protein
LGLEELSVLRRSDTVMSMVARRETRRAEHGLVIRMSRVNASKRQRVDAVKVLRKDMAAEHFAHLGAAS